MVHIGLEGESPMRVSVTQAKAQLTDLVKRAEAGEEIELTRHGQPVVRLQAVQRLPVTGEERVALIRKIQAQVAAKNLPPGPSAARSADFLYDDETGLPK